VTGLRRRPIDGLAHQDATLEQIPVQSTPGKVHTGVLGNGWANQAVKLFLKSLSEADAEAAVRRVAALRESSPGAEAAELSDRIIRRTCQQTAAIGAATSSASLIPVLGTLATLLVGVTTDLTATLKLQAEMVLEIAEAHGFPLETLDQRRLVFIVTGVSTGSNVLLRQTGKALSRKVCERYARAWLSRALPFVGVATSSATNAFSSYLIGRRAEAYFKLRS
jgi:hypothetical protein